MEAAGELKWDIEPHNGRNSFFTRESYEKYSLGPTVTELLLLCNKPASAEPDPTPAKSETQDLQSPVTESKSSVCVPPKKNFPPFPEPRVPYPRPSLLTASEQDTYVKLMIKFINSTKNSVNALQMKEYSHYEFLKLKLSSEHMEFQKFLQNAARSCAEDYNVLCADATRYIQEMIKSCQSYVKNYPELYAVHDMTSILGGKFIPDLSLNLEKCLLKLGSVNYVKVKFPTHDILLPTSYQKVSQTMPPVRKAGHLHKNVTSDPNTSKLVSKYCPQVVLTVQALYTLLNNHGPVYNEQWEIPIRVETINGTGDKPSKVVYVDSPLPKKALSTREKSQIFHEVILDKFMLKNSQVVLKAVSLDRQEEERLADRAYAHRKPACDSKEVDFETDVTELETFGSMNVDKSNAAKSDGRSPDFLLQHPTNSQLDKKETINTQQVKLGIDSKRIREEKSSCQDSDMSETSSKSQIGALSSTSIETQSDSDEERLVIDDNFDKRIEMIPPSVSKATTSTPVQAHQKLPKKTSRKVSSDVGPLGQILKMQAELLKPGANKMERTSTENAGKNEQLPQNPVQCQSSVVLVSDSSQETQRKETTDCSRVLLSNDLLALEEDENEYTVEADENLVYKLFSLDDILLLLQGSVHTVLTGRKRSSLKVTKKQTPVFVLTKMDYQYCYGVESLTESESCRLWTESLVHSNCTLYVGHVDAFTSKFFMLEEVSAQKLKENVSAFKPANCLNILRHILKWLTSLQDGSYLLSHASKDSSVCLYKSGTDKTRGTYNLLEAHSDLPKAPSSLSVPWVPLNPNLLLSYHIHHGRPPCTFPPVPAAKAGIPKLFRKSVLKVRTDCH
ncbi:PREDICTED: little elongation complex subunit 2 [Nanorana parkeri]|uniref:little elongation complex subunit 2 n=1 Tax=Nanorana parkeri TaxID=125878 RepID=UPI000854B75D|nr:PREDICTED: little elongation complex subunit 2 [Nanorana parkeri]